MLDGSYGLQLSPDGRFLFTAHRGLNQVLVYSYPDMKLVHRVPFPPIRKYFPQHLGLLDDTRLGFHHSALSATSVG
jgi:6-phosphogluconolactonase (cycloisomerase 2 family)